MREIPVTAPSVVSTELLHQVTREVGQLLALTAVAVWDHRPNAAELLAKRLAHGWRPTPTKLKTGDQVLGYAAAQ